MTASRDPDRLIHTFFEEGLDELPDPAYDAVRDRIEQTRQRAGIGLWRTSLMSNTLKYGLTVAAGVLVVVIGYQLTGGSSPGGPAATETPQPSVSSEPSAVIEFPTFPGRPKPIDAGTYYLSPDLLDPDSSFSISFDVPVGWLSCTNNARLLCLADGFGEVTIDIVTNIVADPCDWTSLRDPAVGPTVEDLVSAISSLPWSEVTSPTDVTVDGFVGLEFEVAAPAESACTGEALSVWVAPLNGRVHEVWPGDRNRLRIVDVEGTRVVIVGAYRPGITSSQDLAEINAIIDSVRIERKGV